MNCPRCNGDGQPYEAKYVTVHAYMHPNGCLKSCRCLNCSHEWCEGDAFVGDLTLGARVAELEKVAHKPVDLYPAVEAILKKLLGKRKD